MSPEAVSDLDKLSNNLAYMQLQLWALYGIIIFIGGLLGYMVKDAFEGFKVTQKEQGKDIANIRERMAKRDGEGEMADKFLEAAEIISGAIDRKNPYLRSNENR